MKAARLEQWRDGEVVNETKSSQQVEQSVTCPSSNCFEEREFKRNAKFALRKWQQNAHYLYSGAHRCAIALTRTCCMPRRLHFVVQANSSRLRNPDSGSIIRNWRNGGCNWNIRRVSGGVYSQQEKGTLSLYYVNVNVPHVDFVYRENINWLKVLPIMLIAAVSVQWPHQVNTWCQAVSTRWFISLVWSIELNQALWCPILAPLRHWNFSVRLSYFLHLKMAISEFGIRESGNATRYCEDTRMPSTRWAFIHRGSCSFQCQRIRHWERGIWSKDGVPTLSTWKTSHTRFSGLRRASTLPLSLMIVLTFTTLQLVAFSIQLKRPTLTNASTKCSLSM